jgi:hypothetical protein
MKAARNAGRARLQDDRQRENCAAYGQISILR